MKLNQPTGPTNNCQSRFKVMIFCDGATAQFKNKYTLSNLCFVNGISLQRAMVKVRLMLEDASNASCG
ncbi:hypothetical protein PR048_031864 [Dryococelus australis]|uniref:Uncharacterized protein n=1 Tax=Dryococelus australis TaxID=614101 RepID=A0ABQ9G6I3_9NEOP|nr:hypothetical protein PR048_031864 [Dryococelus australis]